MNKKKMVKNWYFFQSHASNPSTSAFCDQKMRDFLPFKNIWILFCHILFFIHIIAISSYECDYVTIASNGRECAAQPWALKEKIWELMFSTLLVFCLAPKSAVNNHQRQPLSSLYNTALQELDMYLGRNQTPFSRNRLLYNNLALEWMKKSIWNSTNL